MARTPEQKLDEVKDALWPPGDEQRDWDVYRDLREVAEIIGEGSRSQSRAGEYVRRIYATLYPKDDPEAERTADMLQDVAWTVEEYYGEKFTEVNPRAGRPILQGLVTAGLATVGIAGVAMGVRAQRAAQPNPSLANVVMPAVLTGGAVWVGMLLWCSAQLGYLGKTYSDVQSAQDRHRAAGDRWYGWR